jgi:malonate-semialdehyde dehydrogenase (acetylating) / methylmalonate-semialdehyde dehydrogenase
MYRLQQLLRQNADTIVNSIVLEQGKTVSGMVYFNGISMYTYKILDAHGELLRGLQVVETAAGITSTLMGDKIEGICHAFLAISLIATNTSNSK